MSEVRKAPCAAFLPVQGTHGGCEWGLLEQPEVTPHRNLQEAPEELPRDRLRAHRTHWAGLRIQRKKWLLFWFFFFNLKIIRNVSRRVGDLSFAGSAARGISRRAARAGGHASRGDGRLGEELREGWAAVA